MRCEVSGNLIFSAPRTARLSQETPCWYEVDRWFDVVHEKIGQIHVQKEREALLTSVSRRSFQNAASLFYPLA